jgi:hypothetical protein
MKKIILFCLFITILLTGCTAQSDSDRVQQLQQQKILNEGTTQTGMPNIHNFFERKMMKRVLEKRDNPDLTTYVYTQTMNGKFVYIGRAVGYGLPYSTQYTNPMKLDGNSSSYVTVPQADPNGLFSPSSADATWILLVNEDTNENEIMYLEPNAVITESKMPKRLVEAWSLPSNY